jgi:uncharacterized protein (TIGR00255 family)
MAQLYSMTGFGKGVLSLPGKKISIELKSLNSKQTDISLRLPPGLRTYEGKIRQTLAQALQRGKIEGNFFCEVTGTESAPQVNEELATGYTKQLLRIAAATGAGTEVLPAVMRMPDVLQSSDEDLSWEEWEQVEQTLLQTINSLQGFRADEALELKKDLELRLSRIEAGLQAVAPFEEERKERVKTRLQKSLDQLKVEVDQDRFEQELIYYLEKYDVTEEKVRLAAHLKYFKELMNAGSPVGKKLGFVSQELGREINTLGSKANHAGLQKVVVEMKDELEKIKEQVLNIL